MGKHGSFSHHQSTPCKVSQEMVQWQNKPAKDMEGCVGLTIRMERSQMLNRDQLDKSHNHN